jgi:hypothetical protein
MNNPRPFYISASRRTDIPRFFLDGFFAAWRQGEITYDAGYGRSYTVSLEPADVLGYIFWSKDFSRFIAHPEFGNLIAASNAIFHFTINDCPDLEPNVPALGYRLATLRRLCDMVGPQRVLWRYDPICKYRAPNGQLAVNAEPFFEILPLVKAASVTRCYFSFMTRYAKLRKRDAVFGEFDESEKAELALRMLDAAASSGMMLYNCCNPEVLGLAPDIRQAHCIDNEGLLETNRFGVHPALSPKPTRAGCGCFESRDIGSYLQRCLHRCAYCYANPG